MSQIDKEPATPQAPTRSGWAALPPEVLARLAEDGVTLPPTQDELPYDDGEHMESPRHAAQMYLLIETLDAHWTAREDVFIGGNMFVYFSLDHVRNQDFRGPDFFFVQGVPRGERRSWVVWEEGKGPDLVIELLSESTAEFDLGAKKTIYQDRLKVQEYYCFDPFSGHLVGWALVDGAYEPIPADGEGRLVSKQAGLALVRARGTYLSIEAEWLRWAAIEGPLLPTNAEQARAVEARAETEATARKQAEADRDRLAAKLRELGIDPDQLS